MKKDKVCGEGGGEGGRVVSRVSFKGLSVFELWPCPFFIGREGRERREREIDPSGLSCRSIPSPPTLWPDGELPVQSAGFTHTLRDPRRRDTPCKGKGHI